MQCGCSNLAGVGETLLATKQIPTRYLTITMFAAFTFGMLVSCGGGVDEGVDGQIEETPTARIEETVSGGTVGGVDEGVDGGIEETPTARIEETVSGGTAECAAGLCDSGGVKCG